MPAPAQTLSQRLQTYWFYPDRALLGLHERAMLRLLEGVYRLLLWLRERIWVAFRPTKTVQSVRTLAVGNLIVGGAGKTPTVMALASAIGGKGLRAALLSRGYKSEAEHAGPRILMPSDLANTRAQEVGDEAWLLCWRTQMPVGLGKDRHASLLMLKSRFPDLGIAILDDGLAQRQLHADQQILVLDSRGFGNGHCLPLGPLREPAVNLKRFDAWVNNGLAPSHENALGLPLQRIELTQTNGPWVSVGQWQVPDCWLDLDAGIEKFRSAKILAVAGIAVPERFFESLRGFGLEFDALALKDHDPQLVDKTLRHCENQPYDVILMTEKDAVKFFHHPDVLRQKMWALRRQAQLDSTALERLMHGSETS
jgi:tetraacyldisaccharide 4'-kinase